jgi:TolA-binding protein
LELKPKKANDIKVKLARALAGAGKRDEAKTTLDEVLKADPEHPEALRLKKDL